MKSSGRRVFALAAALCLVQGAGARQGDAEPDASREGRLARVNAGRLAQVLGHSTESLSVYAEVLRTSLATGDTLMAALLLDLIGEVHEASGEFQRALASYESGMTLLEQGRADGVGPVLAEVQALLERSEKSVPPSAGLPIGTDVHRGEIPDVGALLSAPRPADELAAALMLNAGNMYLGQMQTRQADELYARALDVARDLGLARLEQRVLTNQAWSALKTRQLERAESRLRAALAAAPASPESFELRRLYLALGVANREEGKLVEAIADLEQALELYARGGDDRGRVRAMAHLGLAHLLGGDLARAQERYIAALALNETVGDRETDGHVRAGLATVYRRLNQRQEALKHYEAYLDVVQELGEAFHTDQGRMSLLEDHDRNFEAYVDLALDVALESAAPAIARHAIERVRDRALAALQVGRSGAASPLPGHLPASYVQGSEAGPFALLRDIQAAPATGIDVRQMAPGVALQGLPELPGAPPALESARSATPVPSPAVTFLEYYAMQDRTAIVVLTADRVHAAAADIGSTTLDALVAEYLATLDLEGHGRLATVDPPLGASPPAPARARRSATEVARELYRLLVEPVKAHLPIGSPQPLVIVPHRGLWRLPFAALQDGGGGYFGDQCVLTYAASEGTWREAASRPRSADPRRARAWVVGNPSLPRRVQACGLSYALAPLPHAEAEARAVAELFGDRAERFIGAEADRLRLEAWHGAYGVLHLATHGVVCEEDPLGSFLMLSPLDEAATRLDLRTGKVEFVLDPRLEVTLDGLPPVPLVAPGEDATVNVAFPGVLEARVVVNRFRLEADLVTLSACQTGLGRTLGQGTIGFTRAFLAAGARSLVVSLWQVDDESTMNLMLDFYGEYLKHGNKGLALQHAMRKARERHPEPALWAAFTLVGLAE